MSYEIGKAAEKELAEIFENNGLSAIKVPLSGRSQALPDIIVPRKGILYGFEVKTLTNKEEATFSGKSFDNLMEWLLMLRREGIPAKGFLAVKLIDRWFFVEIDRRTKDVRIPCDNMLELDEMLRILKGRRRRKRVNCSIRIMGSKEDVYKLLGIIRKCLEKNGYIVKTTELEVYKDKKTREEIDTTRTRIYINLKRK
ncbi:MAG: hypothetical protein ACTSX9_05695 [Candidatus Njordarchaeales archaeon]